MSAILFSKKESVSCCCVFRTKSVIFECIPLQPKKNKKIIKIVSSSTLSNVQLHLRIQIHIKPTTTKTLIHHHFRAAYHIMYLVSTVYVCLSYKKLNDQLKSSLCHQVQNMKMHNCENASVMFVSLMLCQYQYQYRMNRIITVLHDFQNMYILYRFCLYAF